MTSFTKWIVAVAASVVLTGAAAAADAVVPGTIKSFNAATKEIVVSDANTGKDVTIKFGTDVFINRGGEVSKNDLKAGDKVNVCHDNGILTWTARYILVQEGDTKDCVLVLGTVKSFSADGKELVFTDMKGKDTTYPMGTAIVRLNRVESKIADAKIGDTCIIVVEGLGTKDMLKSLAIERTK